MSDGQHQEGGAHLAVTAITGGTARVGSRQYLASEHLWNARRNARRCREREDALVAAGFQGVDMEQRSLAVASVLTSVAFLEALVNEVWQDAADSLPGQPNSRLTGIPEPAVARLRELWQSDRVERALSPLDKCRIALVCADKAALDQGQEPYQSVKALVELRNALVHFKPEIQWDTDVHRIEKVLGRRVSENPLPQGSPWFPNRVLGAGLAEFSPTVCVELASLWRQRLGLQRDFLSDFAAWPVP